MNELTEPESADAYCRFLARRHYENFDVVSSLLLPKDIALDLMRIYAFCRTTDDLGDESGERGLERLETWRAQLSDLFSGKAPVHPVLLALRQTITRHRKTAERECDDE